jgi:hypothetical protein
MSPEREGTRVAGRSPRVLELTAAASTCACLGALTGHSVSTVPRLGWAGAKNGALLERASGVVDVFVTMDTDLE